MIITFLPNLTLLLIFQVVYIHFQMDELVIAINISIDIVDMKEKKKEEMYVYDMIRNQKMANFSSGKGQSCLKIGLVLKGSNVFSFARGVQYRSENPLGLLGARRRSQGGRLLGNMTPSHLIFYGLNEDKPQMSMSLRQILIVGSKNLGLILNNLNQK